MSEPTTQDRFKRGVADAGRYFDFMAQFVNFQPEHAEAIRATRFVVEKHIPGIVADFYATQDECTHADGPLSEGLLDGPMVVCPWHDSCFDVTNGAVLKGLVTEPLKTFRVVVDGDVGWVE